MRSIIKGRSLKKRKELSRNQGAGLKILLRKAKIKRGRSQSLEKRKRRH